MTRRSLKGVPPHYINEEEKEVVFHIPGGFPTTMILPSVMKRYFPDYKCSVIRCEETFYRLRGRGNR